MKLSDRTVVALSAIQDIRTKLRLNAELLVFSKRRSDQAAILKEIDNLLDLEIRALGELRRLFTLEREKAEPEVWPTEIGGGS